MLLTPYSPPRFSLYPVLGVVSPGLLPQCGAGHMGKGVFPGDLDPSLREYSSTSVLF